MNESSIDRAERDFESTVQALREDGLSPIPAPTLKAGIPRFGGSWPAHQARQVGRMAVAAWKAGARDGHAAATSGAGTWAYDEQLYISQEHRTADALLNIIVMTSYTVAYHAAEGVIPVPEHPSFLAGQQVTTTDGKTGILTGTAYVDGFAQILIGEKLDAVPRGQITGPVVLGLPGRGRCCELHDVTQCLCETATCCGSRRKARPLLCTRYGRSRFPAPGIPSGAACSGIGKAVPPDSRLTGAGAVRRASR